MFFNLTVITMDELDLLPSIMEEVFHDEGTVEKSFFLKTYSYAKTYGYAKRSSMKEGEEITHDILEDFLGDLSRAFQCESSILWVNGTLLRDLPLRINCDDLVKRSLAMWRLKIGK